MLVQNAASLAPDKLKFCVGKNRKGLLFKVYRVGFELNNLTFKHEIHILQANTANIHAEGRNVKL